MPRFILSLGLCFVVIAPSSAIAQMNPGNPHVLGAVGCDDSPTPGKRPPNTDCAVLVHKNFDALPPAPLVWRFENFPTTQAALGASTPVSAVVEAGGKVWLLTLAARGGRSKGATFVAETELLRILRDEAEDTYRVGSSGGLVSLGGRLEHIPGIALWEEYDENLGGYR
jgi:hypothetical protein